VNTLQISVKFLAWPKACRKQFIILLIYEHLSKDDSPQPFKAGLSWFCNCRKRYNFHSTKIRGETNYAEGTVTELHHITKIVSYSSQQIYNTMRLLFFRKG
jgi:hypothetical protein